MAPILGYWNIRGLGEMCRLMMRYHGEEFENKEYVCGPAPTFDRSDWTSKKDTLGLPFPNLPYYIEGDLKITQSSAILEYLADKYDMLPHSKAQRAELKMLNAQISDLRNSYTSIVYNPEYEKLVGNCKEKIRNNLRGFESYLGDKQWLGGNKVNYPDFNFCELLNAFSLWDPKCLDDCPKLKAYLRRFENLPKIKEYMESAEFKKRPCNNKPAKWGSTA